MAERFFVTVAATAKIILAITGIFVAGTVTGGFVGVRIAESRTRNQISPERFGPAQMERLAQQLDLTSEQKKKILPLIEQTADEIKKARRESFQATAGLFDKMDAQVARELTDAQRKRLAEMRAAENERRKQWLAERAKRNEGRPPGSPGNALGREPPAGGPLPPRGERPIETR